MRRWMKLFSLTLLALPLVVMLAGQLGLLRGQAPDPIDIAGSTGATADRQLAPIREDRPNSVASQATTPYHQIAPLRLQGEPAAAFLRLRSLVRQTPGVRIIEETDTYLRAECETRLLRFVDDLELLLDAPAGVVQVRSAARLGRKDFGVNRARIEALRTALDSQPGAS